MHLCPKKCVSTWIWAVFTLLLGGCLLIQLLRFRISQNTIGQWHDRWVLNHVYYRLRFVMESLLKWPVKTPAAPDTRAGCWHLKNRFDVGVGGVGRRLWPWFNYRNQRMNVLFRPKIIYSFIYLFHWSRQTAGLIQANLACPSTTSLLFECSIYLSTPWNKSLYCLAKPNGGIWILPSWFNSDNQTSTGASITAEFCGYAAI